VPDTCKCCAAGWSACRAAHGCVSREVLAPAAPNLGSRGNAGGGCTRGGLGVRQQPTIPSWA